MSGISLMTPLILIAAVRGHEMVSAIGSGMARRPLKCARSSRRSGSVRKSHRGLRMYEVDLHVPESHLKSLCRRSGSNRHDVAVGEFGIPCIYHAGVPAGRRFGVKSQMHCK